jgi:hypothetical protein
MRDIFIHPSGQDDNLGDSALRAGLIRLLSADDLTFHICLDGQSSDYQSGIPIRRRDKVYQSRRQWWAASRRVKDAVFVVNAGEINPTPELPYPHPARVAELESIVRGGGSVIVAGIGVKDPATASRVVFSQSFEDARVMSWRDEGSRDAAGFGSVAPDWAFALGAETSSWAPLRSRDYLSLTLRFDRPWPGDRWIDAVKALGDRLGARIVTVAQVARDAPMAVRLAEATGGQYLVPSSMRHDDLEAYVRAAFARSKAVVSDRAHALIIGATEGAYPLGTAADPQKIERLLNTAGIGTLTGHHDEFEVRSERLEAEYAGLATAVDQARKDLGGLAERIRSSMDSVA